MFHKRKYKPQNPEKYLGDPSNIIMRSSWEVRFAIWCDKNPKVLRWQSEETVVPYRCPTDNKIHRYFIDFRVQVKDKNDLLKTYLVEIKPEEQTKPPNYPGKRTKKYLTESFYFIKNQAKWEAAKNFAKDRGWDFIVLTEKHLGIN